MCVLLLLSQVFHWIKAGTTKSCALTIATMNGGENGGSSGERDRKRLQEALFTTDCHFFLSHFIKLVVCHLFAYWKKITSYFVSLAGVKWQLRSCNSHKLIVVKYINPLRTSVASLCPRWERKLAKEEGGVQYHSLSPLLLGSGGESGWEVEGFSGRGVDVGKDRFIQWGEFLAWLKMKWFVVGV